MSNHLERFGEYSRLAAAGITSAASVLAVGNAVEGRTGVPEADMEMVEKIKPVEDALQQPMENGADLYVPEQPHIDISAISPTAQVEPTVRQADSTHHTEKKVSAVETHTKSLNLSQLLRTDQHFGQFLQIWNKKNSRGANFDRRGYSAHEAGKIQAEFSKELQLRVYMGLFNNPPETAEVQMKKYYRSLIDSENYRTRMHDAVVASSTEFGVPVDVIYGVIGVESGGQMHKISNQGAVGAMQVKHDGAYAEMVRLAGIPEYQKIFGSADRWKKMDIGNLKDNIMVGTAYLRFLFDRYHDWNYALMAYNAGPAGFEKSLVRLHNQKAADRHSREKNNALQRKQVNVEKPSIVTYDAVRKNFEGNFLKKYYPTFATVLADAGTEGLNVFYVLKAGVLTEPTKIAIEEGRIQP